MQYSANVMEFSWHHDITKMNIQDDDHGIKYQTVQKKLLILNLESDERRSLHFDGNSKLKRFGLQKYLHIF